MKVKIISFMILLMFLIFNLFVNTGVADANDPVFIWYDDTLDLDVEDDLFVASSNGSYYAFSYIEFEDHWELWRSYDDGLTWVIGNDLSGIAQNQDNFACWIDDEDYIHTVMVTEGYEVEYNRYSCDGDSWDRQFTIDAVGGYDIGHSIVVANQDNDVMVIYDRTDVIVTDVLYRYWHEDIEEWSSPLEWNSRSSIRMSVDVDSNGNFYLLYADSNDLYLSRYDISTDIISEVTVNSGLSYTRYNDLAIDEYDNFHIVYEGYYTGTTDICINYTYGTWDDFEEDEVVYYSVGEDASSPQISYTSDGDVNIVWHCNDPHTSTNYILGKEGNYNDWSSTIYYSTGSVGDSHIHPNMPYQHYPSSTWLTDGTIGIYENSSDNNLMFFSEGTKIQYEGGEGEGQQGGDLDDYLQRCTGALLYDEQVYTSNISNYMESIGNITIKGLELYVNDNQIEIVTNDRNDYTGWVNGVNIGNPEYIFQTSPTRYKLQWLNLDVNVGTNDIITEFQNAQQGIFAYWWHIPLGYTDFAKYGGNAGDGYFDGTLFGSALGLGTCIYYDVNVPTESDNTYTLNLLSNDPHWKGNTTTFTITVDGSTSWTWLIQDPNGNTVSSNVYTDGDNIFYQDLIVPEHWINGEYTIYALDLDAYPSGLSIADNITFNVTVYGGSLDNWIIEASQDPIVVGTWQSLSYFVPSGYPYAILWQYHPTSESGYIKQGVGDGELHTLQWVLFVDKEGTWSVDLQNRTSSDTTEWVLYRDTFQAVGQISNFIEIGEQGDYICNTGYATVNGFYDGGVGTLWFYKNNDTFKTYAITTGDFTVKFYPDDLPKDFGIYQIYLTNIDLEILEWSRGLTVEVYYCPITPTDPALVPMYRGNVIMGSILTLVIIIVLMLLPYGFMMALSKAGQTVTIPALVPIGFGIVGFIFSSAMQFINPMYLVAFMIIMLIMSLIILYGKFGKGDGD